ncbi:MAG: glycosyltransferase family 4 protein [Lewinellaceae bacterium]|nr:glycosyltransferase family 4 protein [Lewinellaceae bacterium]
MKILFILPEFHPHPGGGIATFYLNLLPKLKAIGISPVVWIGSAFTQGQDTFEYQGIPVKQLPPENFLKHLKGFQRLNIYPDLQKHLASAWALYELASQESGIDLVETVDWGLGYIPWVLDPSRKVVTRLHGSIAQIETCDPKAGMGLYGDITRLVEFATLPYSNLITYSENNRTFWEEKLSKRIELIDPIYSFPADLHESEPDMEPYALVVGRIQHWKGPQLLCEALKKVPDQIKFYWIGRDTDYLKKGSSFSRYLSEKHPDIWGKRIIPLGLRPNTETLSWMKNAKFGLVCSIWDMFNLTALEWLSLEKPLICSKGAGAWNIVKKAGGAVFDPNNPEQLARLIREHQTSKELIVPTYRIQYEEGKLLEETRQFYHRVLEKPTERPMPPSWAINLVIPSNSESGREAAMDQWPLRQVLFYTSKRLLKKFLRKK